MSGSSHSADSKKSSPPVSPVGPNGLLSNSSGSHSNNSSSSLNSNSSMSDNNSGMSSRSVEQKSHYMRNSGPNSNLSHVKSVAEQQQQQLLGLGLPPLTVLPPLPPFPFPHFLPQHLAHPGSMQGRHSPNASNLNATANLGPNSNVSSSNNESSGGMPGNNNNSKIGSSNNSPTGNPAPLPWPLSSGSDGPCARHVLPTPPVHPNSMRLVDWLIFVSSREFDQLVD